MEAAECYPAHRYPLGDPGAHACGTIHGGAEERERSAAGVAAVPLVRRDKAADGMPRAVRGRKRKVDKR